MTTTGRTPAELRVAADLAASLAVVSWGVGNVLIKVFDEGALTLAFNRFWMALLLTSAVLVLRGGRIGRRDIVAAFPSGVAFGLNTICMFSALKLTTVANATVIAALQPVAVLFIATRRFGERVRPLDAMLTLIAIGGVALVTFGSVGLPEWRLAGDAIAVLSLLTWTWYFVESKKARRAVTALQHQVIVVGVSVVVVLVAIGFSDQPAAPPEAGGWLAAFLLVVIPGGGHLLMSWAHAHTSLSIASLLTLGTPVISAIGAAVVLDESLTLVQAAGLLLVSAALGVLVTRSPAFAAASTSSPPTTVRRADADPTVNMRQDVEALDTVGERRGPSTSEDRRVDRVNQPAPFDEWSARWRPDTPTDPEALRAWQLARAWEVVERVAADNPFYRGRLVLPTERSAAAFRPLPITTKDEVIADCAEHPPYGSRSTADEARVRMVVETSGTTGLGKEVYVLDEADERAVYQAEAYGFWWAGVRPGTKVLLTLPVGVTAAGQWYLGGLRLIGANVLSVGAYDTQRKVEVLQRYRPSVIVGTPTYVQRLAVATAQSGIDPASLGVRSLVVAGEAYSPGWVEAIQERWGGAVLYEQYGCTERVMAWTCPGGVLRDGELGVLHFPPELSYWEVIDPDTGEEVADGEWGELISTPLQAFSSPLVRFATRDRVQFVAAGGCRCGRPVPGIRAGVVQRYDDMLKVRGVNVWPAALDHAVFSVPGVVDYRGRVHVDADGREVLNVTVEAEPSSIGVAAGVKAAINRAVGLAASVDIVGPGTITGSVPPGFVKISRWRDDRLETRAQAVSAQKENVR